MNEKVNTVIPTDILVVAINSLKNNRSFDYISNEF